APVTATVETVDGLVELPQATANMAAAATMTTTPIQLPRTFMRCTPADAGWRCRALQRRCHWHAGRGENFVTLAKGFAAFELTRASSGRRDGRPCFGRCATVGLWRACHRPVAVVYFQWFGAFTSRPLIANHIVV